MVSATMAVDPGHSLLMSLIEKEIPDGRNALLQSHNNLAELSSYCKENYMNSSDKSKTLQETKQYASQSLASVAYQIHSLSLNILQMMDQQTKQFQRMQSNANNIGLLVDIHKEKIARREIGLLSSSKNYSRLNKVVPPAQREKVRKYKREVIDYSVLDDIGHSVKTERNGDTASQQQRFSTSSSGSLKESSTSSVHSSSHGSSLGLQGSHHSSDRKGAFGSTLPPPHRPPIAPVAPFKVKAAPVPPVLEPLMVPPDACVTSMPHINMTEPDYNNMDVMSLPPPPPPLPLEIEDDYQIPLNNMPATTVFDLLPDPPNNLCNSNHADTENIHEPVVRSNILTPPPPLMTPEGDVIPEFYEEKVVAIYDYEKLREDELELHEGDVIYVIKKNEDGWFEGIKDGMHGLFPGNYAVPL